MAQAGNTHSEVPPEDFAVAAAVHLSIPGDPLRTVSRLASNEWLFFVTDLLMYPPEIKRGNGNYPINHVNLNENLIAN